MARHRKQRKEKLKEETVVEDLTGREETFLLP
jgi:hypothetical protein